MTKLLEFSPAELAALAQSDVARALQEDVGPADLTAALVPPGRRITARVLVREPAVLCGQPWAEAVIRHCDPSAELRWQVAEGQTCQADQVVLEVQGEARALLTAERTALNFLQLLSAVATRTAQHVAAVQGTRARIVDTRKTLPRLRLAPLYDAVLIKGNHIAAAGGIRPVLAAAQAVAAQAQFIEIEVETLAQLQEALEAGARMVLLDNMDLPTLHEAVRLNAGRAVLEISGGVTLERLAELAATGVDRISIGGLTKDVKATDFSMRFEDWA